MENEREKIIEKLNIFGLATEEQDAIIGKLEENIIDRVNLAVLEKLSSADREELNLMASDLERQKFISGKIAGLQALVEEISRQTVDEFILLKN
ncbi:MAG: hypothetical protein NTY66_00330 [Candidatus Vogelbacteria bacterium]|nr:hypothetical protein [Candidatus Vogelbacteria bacterium]